MRTILALLLLLAGCSSPTAPDIFEVPTLYWAQTAPGCDPRRPIEEPKVRRDSTTIEGSVLEVVYVRPDDMLYAIFHSVGGKWYLCEWDTSDN